MEKIMPYLEQLASKLGVAVNHLWGVLVRQSVIDGISNLIVGAVYIAIIVIMVMFFKPVYIAISTKHKNLVKDRVENGTGYAGSYGISSISEDFFNTMKIIYPITIIIAIIIFFTLGLSDITYGIKETVNPEYYAIQNIINSIK